MSEKSSFDYDKSKEKDLEPIQELHENSEEVSDVENHDAEVALTAGSCIQRDSIS